MKIDWGDSLLLGYSRLYYQFWCGMWFDNTLSTCHLITELKGKDEK